MVGKTITKTISKGIALFAPSSGVIVTKPEELTPQATQPADLEIEILSIDEIYNMNIDQLNRLRVPNL